MRRKQASLTAEHHLDPQLRSTWSSRYSILYDEAENGSVLPWYLHFPFIKVHSSNRDCRAATQQKVSVYEDWEKNNAYKHLFWIWHHRLNSENFQLPETIKQQSAVTYFFFLVAEHKPSSQWELCAGNQRRNQNGKLWIMFKLCAASLLQAPTSRCGINH